MELKLENHSWYLGAELAWTSLFSDRVDPLTKEQIVSIYKKTSGVTRLRSVIEIVLRKLGIFRALKTTVIVL